MHILDLNFLDLSSNNRNNENENKKRIIVQTLTFWTYLKRK